MSALNSGRLSSTFNTNPDQPGNQSYSDNAVYKVFLGCDMGPLSVDEDNPGTFIVIHSRGIFDPPERIRLIL
jgi:hypothetical protein